MSVFQRKLAGQNVNMGKICGLSRLGNGGPENGQPFLFFVETAVKYERFYSGQEHRSAFGGKVAHNFSWDILNRVSGGQFEKTTQIMSGHF